MDGFSRDQLVLYSELPVQVDTVQPEPVETVAITWNDMEIVWMEGETIVECVETELSGASDEDKELVQSLLREEIEYQTVIRQLLVEEKKARYHNMIETNDMSVAALQARRVYKVYPQDSRLEPITVTFGGVQFETGFRKNAHVNRYIGNAERFF